MSHAVSMIMIGSIGKNVNRKEVMLALQNVYCKFTNYCGG